MVDQIIKNMETSISGELENKTKMFMYSTVINPILCFDNQ